MGKVKSSVRNTYHAICVLCGIVLFMLAVREARADVPAPPELKKVQPRMTRPVYRTIETYDKGDKNRVPRCWFFEVDKDGRLLPADGLPMWVYCVPVEHENRGA